MNLTLNICHLYPDLLNVYGDFGNILILKHRCESRGIEINIHNISLNDEFDPNMYDITFFGGGQDYEQSIVSPDLFKKRDSICEYINNEKVFLAICGGYQLLGNYYETPSGEKIEGLKILDFHTSGCDKRFIGNVIIKNDDDDKIYVGFENHSGKTFLGENIKPLGRVLLGFGNNGDDGFEGAIYKNTYCSYFHGSLLSKNPFLADKMIYTAIKNKYNISDLLSPLDDSFEIKAKEKICELLK